MVYRPRRNSSFVAAASRRTSSLSAQAEEQPETNEVEPTLVSPAALALCAGGPQVEAQGGGAARPGHGGAAAEAAVSSQFRQLFMRVPSVVRGQMRAAKEAAGSRCCSVAPSF
eukprot:1352560-Pleurochrysis_carterae.AAC.1